MPLSGANEKIGVIAGGGQFPILFSRAARRKGFRVVALALDGHAEPALTGEVDVYHTVGLLQVGKMISIFHREGVSQAVMLGSVAKANVFKGAIRPDLKALSILARRRHSHDDHLLRLFADALEEEGIAIKPSTLFLPSLLIEPGRLTRRRPTRRESADVEWGFSLAKDLGRFDIGQCIVVRSKTVLAVEAIEGTDAAIARGGELGRGRAVVIKVAKPQQDLRFDLPSVGKRTIETMAEHGCTCLAVEAGRTLCFDREEMIELADQRKIAVLAIDGGDR